MTRQRGGLSTYGHSLLLRYTGDKFAHLNIWPDSSRTPGVRLINIRASGMIKLPIINRSILHVVFSPLTFRKAQP
jgi:hypothetical protein